MAKSHIKGCLFPLPPPNPWPDLADTAFLHALIIMTLFHVEKASETAQRAVHKTWRFRSATTPQLNWHPNWLYAALTIGQKCSCPALLPNNLLHRPCHPGTLPHCL
jgi:hypothetical protein